MRSKDYDYNIPSDDYEIAEERKREIIDKVKKQVRKGFIAHYQILGIGKNDDEYDFIYEWLDENDIQIRGINGTVSGEIPNYTHIPKMGQSLTTDKLEEEEQKRLFEQLSLLKEEIEQLKEGAQEEIISQNAVLKKAIEEQLKIKQKNYENVRSNLIEHNMKLAEWVTSWKLISKIQLPTEDKKQMAMIGLVNAVDKFDVSKGYKFSTYAAKAIFRRVIREAHYNSETKHSMIFAEQLEMIPEIENQMLVELGRKPKNYEIADILGISLKRVQEIYDLKQIKEHQSLQQEVEERNGEERIIEKLDDGDKLYVDGFSYIMDGIYIDEEELLLQGSGQRDKTNSITVVKFLKKSIEKCLETLTPREEEVLRLRFGLDGGIGQTLEAVGKEFGVNRERIRQIEAGALRKLRRPSRSKMLRDFMDFDEDQR